MNMKFRHALLSLSAMFFACQMTVSASPETYENDVFSCTFYGAGDTQTTFQSHTGTTDWAANQINSVMRAMDTIAGLFSNEAGRKVNVNFIYVDLQIGTGASALPIQSVASSSPYPPLTKKEWTADDLGGRGIASGSGAYVNNLEDVWKYGHNLSSYGADVVVTISTNLHQNGMLYYGESASGISGLQLDMETIILHEMGHPLGFYAPGRDGSKTALEVLTEKKSVPGGLGEPFFDGDTTLAYLQEQGSNVLESYYPYYDSDGMAELGVQLEKDGHISKYVGYKDILMGPTGLGGIVRREYSDLELAMFKDMGWSLTNDPFVAVPEPSVAILGLCGMSGLLLRRRRTV